MGLEDELSALDLRHAALLQAADEHGAGGPGAACAVRRLSAVHAYLIIHSGPCEWVARDIGVACATRHETPTPELPAMLAPFALCPANLHCTLLGFRRPGRTYNFTILAGEA